MSNEITRIVAIDVDGKKVQIEVHIHLSQEEIERIVAPAVLKSLSRQLRSQSFLSRPLNPELQIIREGQDMSDTYRLLYRHMTIVTPGPNPETYDCWLDGRANTVTFQRVGEYGPVGPVETMALDKDGMLKQFDGATITILGSLSTVPRDMQFAGFAASLNREINDFAFSFGRVAPGTDVLQRGIEQIITRRVYDLVESACGDIAMEQSDGRLSVSGMLAVITDMSELPEVSE